MSGHPYWDIDGQQKTCDWDTYGILIELVLMGRIWDKLSEK